jgi:nephrocystin-3
VQPTFPVLVGLQALVLPSPFPHPAAPMAGHSGWQTVRLFISSTPHDFVEERRQLVSHVLPRLRAWCQEHRISLIEVDLRWGAQTNAQKVQTAMQELSRCREENASPFFLSLLSEHYGWVPDEAEIQATEEYGWVPGFSQIAMEIVFGAFRDASPNAYFALRSPSFLAALPDENMDTYLDQEHKQKLGIMKKQIAARFPAAQILHYDAHFEQGTSELLLASNEAFAEAILGFFCDRISSQYPCSRSAAAFDPVSSERNPHQLFVELRGEGVYGRSAIRKQVLGYITSAENQAMAVVTRGCGRQNAASVAFSLGPVQRLLVSFLAVRRHPVMLLAGEAGAGKSALVAAVVRAQSALLPHCQQFFHFVGAVPGSTDLVRLLRRMWNELDADTDIPTTEAELVRLMPVVLENASRRGGCCIFLDALNQLDTDSEQASLSWLPALLPPGVRVVISAIAGSQCDAALSSREMPPARVQVEPLDRAASQELVQNLLSKRHRDIDEDHLALLLSKDGARNPLWLVCACEELRVHPTYSTIAQKIISFDESLLGLILQILDRFEREHGEVLVTAALCFLECSRHGLLETELLELLADHSSRLVYTEIADEPEQSVETADEPEQDAASELKGVFHAEVKAAVQAEDAEVAEASEPGDVTQESAEPPAIKRLDMAVWSPLFQSLRAFLRPVGEAGVGQLDFYHRAISKAVRLKYLSAVPATVSFPEAQVSTVPFPEQHSRDDQRYAFWHGRLADHFEDRCQDQTRRASELPYHLEKVLDSSRLLRAMLDWPTLDRLSNATNQHELLRYCRLVGGYGVFGVALGEQLRLWEATVGKDELLMRKRRIGVFLAEVGQYHVAIGILEGVVEACREDGNEDQVAYSLLALGHSISEREQSGSWDQGQLQRACRYLEESIRIWRSNSVPDQAALAEALTTCAYCRACVGNRSAAVRACAEEGVGIYRSLGHGKLGFALNRLGLIQREASHLDALNTFQEAIAFFEQRCLTTTTVEFSVSLNHVFEIYWMEFPKTQNNTVQVLRTAELFGRHGVWFRENLFGISHPRVAVLRSRLCAFYQSVGLWDEARRLAEGEPAAKPDVKYSFVL